jgi:hypothetical protein
MKSWLAVALLAVSLGGMGGVARAADSVMRASKPEVKKEIVAVIEAQLTAFRKGDVVKAYSYSATGLRAQKPLRVFAMIVKENYPEIWANTRAEYGLVRDDGERAKLLVHVEARESSASYDFLLVKERAGWRIEGVLRHEAARREKV